MQNLKSLASAIAEILKENTKIFGSFPNPGQCTLFHIWVRDFMMGLGKPQLHAKYEVAGSIYYGNINELSLNDKFAF